MEKIDIICIGSMKEKFMRELCSEYAKRLSRFCKFTVTELKEARVPENPSEAEITSALESEADVVLSKISQGAYTVAMCIEGKMLDSVAFSKALENGMRDSGRAVFVIGSSHGLADRVKARADLKLSMSPMTFPHQLARCLLSEQLYRSYKIRNNENYHK